MILFDEEVPEDKYLIHNNSPELKSFDYESYGTRDVPISTNAANMNCFAERFIGSISREALDWSVLFRERQIKRILFPRTSTFTMNSILIKAWIRKRRADTKAKSTEK